MLTYALFVLAHQAPQQHDDGHHKNAWQHNNNNCNIDHNINHNIDHNNNQR